MSKAPRPIKKGVGHPCGPGGSGRQLPGQRDGLQGRQMFLPVLLSSRERGTDKKEEKRLRKSQEGGLGFDAAAWELLKGLGKAGYQAARVGAGKAIQSDLAQKKAMEFISPLVGDTPDKLGNKVGREEVMKQLGAGSPIYQSGTHPYQEGGLLPLLALGGGLLPGLMKQLGTGSPTYQSGTDPNQEGCLLPLLALGGGLLPGLMKQLGGGSKKKKRCTPITASSIPCTLQQLFCRQGGRIMGVLPETISRPQVGMGQRNRRCRPSSHCFQGLPQRKKRI